ncbi:hypothetical protein GXP70_01605 [Paenibacillus lycopersici]|uniref:Uncharacterized protein n=1 Tax=Paenibacillus lycopersici TaxID=2704462 RepID=A0A6C0FRV1_9BACL|nr:hypothetical protein [Paenibacillus lycopersici]QHT58802.1 hypothetical protein GXP70_01605 [Paenibacillus lycopersici]
MRLFRIKAGAAGAGGLAEYLEHCYIGCGMPGIGDAGSLGLEEIVRRMAEAPSPGVQGLERRAEELLAFAQVMQDGDHIIAYDGERMALGDLGDYYYIEQFDNDEDRSGHRRGVTWIRSLQREDLHPELLAFLAEDGEIGQFGRALDMEELERLLTRPAAPGGTMPIDEATIREALDILKAAMRSGDPERRERAAIAILQAAGRL